MLKQDININNMCADYILELRNEIAMNASLSRRIDHTETVFENQVCKSAGHCYERYCSTYCLMQCSCVTCNNFFYLNIRITTFYLKRNVNLFRERTTRTINNEFTTFTISNITSNVRFVHFRIKCIWSIGVFSE